MFDRLDASFAGKVRRWWLPLALRIVGIAAVLAALASSFAAQPALARSSCATGAPVPGTYNLGSPPDPLNAATGTGSGPFTMDTTGTDYAFVTFVPSQTVTFSQLTVMSASFTSTAGGVGLGSPRLSIYFVGQGSNNLVTYFGPSPGFSGDDAALNATSGLNFIGNNDAGRYDTSHLGGSPSTTYSAATVGGLAEAGSFQVQSVSFVMDNYAGHNLTLNGITLCKTATQNCVITNHVAKNQYMAGCNLSGQNLSNDNLQGADLNGADLSGATLYNVSLSGGATLDGANLSGAHLSNVDLSNASLYGADLKNATLSNVKLNNADVTTATSCGAHFTNVNQTGEISGPLTPTTGC